MISLTKITQAAGQEIVIHEDPTSKIKEAVARVTRSATTDGGAIIDALNTEPRLPRVSRGCLTCQYQGACDAWAMVKPASSAVALINEYLFVVANKERLELLVRELTSDGPFQLDRTLVGTVGKVSKVAGDDAAELLWDAWLDGSDPTPGLTRGMLRAAKLTATNIRAVAKVLHPKPADKGKRAALVERCTMKKIKPKFGIHADK